MLEILINNENKYPINKKELERAVFVTAEFCKKVKGGVEISLIDNRLMRRLNREWRGMDKTTDVLSFAWGEDKKMPSNFLGQIFISYPKIKVQAKEYKVGIKEEFLRMTVHGLLHLVGYDHMVEKDAKKMFALQDKILSKITC